MPIGACCSEGITPPTITYAVTVARIAIEKCDRRLWAVIYGLPAYLVPQMVLLGAAFS